MPLLIINSRVAKERPTDVREYVKQYCLTADPFTRDTFTHNAELRPGINLTWNRWSGDIFVSIK